MKGVCMKKLKHHLGCALAGLLLGTLLFLNCLSPVSASSISWDTAVKNGSNVYLSYYYLMKDGLYDYTMNNYESAYIKEVTKRENSTAFQTLLTSYRIATFSLSEGVSFTNKETGFYEALIFDMLYDDSTESIFSTLVDSSVDAATDVNTQAAALTATVSKELLDLNIDIIKNIPFDLSTDDGMSQLLENLQKCEALSDFMEHIGKAEKFTGHFKTALEFVQRLCQVKTVYNAGYYQKQIIDDLYLDASMSLNPAMKTALKKYSEILNQNLSEIDITAILLGDTATQKIAESLSKKISKGLWAVLGGELGTLYGTAISTGQSVGKFTSDTLFNTSESVSSYYKLRASVQMELLLKKRVKSYENIVCQYPTSENARKFNDSVQMLNKIYVSGLDSFEEFVKKTYQEGTINEIIGNCNALLGGNKESVYKEFLKHLDGIRSTLKLSIHTDEMRAYRTYEDILKDLAEENETTDVTTASGLEVKDIDSILPDDKKPDVVLPKLRSDSTSMYGSLSKDKTLQADSEEWGDFALTNGTLNVNGFNMTIYGDLNMSGGTIDLNGGTLTVTGNINQSGGTITVNGGTLNTYQNYQLYTETTNEETGKTTLSYGGTLKMVKAKSVVNVSGDYKTYAYETSSYLNNGTLNIYGNFAHLGSTFSPDDSLTINFLKNTITNISFENTSSSFNANTHFKSGKIQINSPFSGWKLAGDLNIYGTFPSFTNTLDLNGYTLTVNGNLKQSDFSGYMYINGGTLNVNGNYLLYSETTDSTTHIKTKSYGGPLKMVKQTDTVNVSGNYETFANETSSYLNDGTLNIYGNFTHWGYPFNPGDNLAINFLKDETTNISFANTGSSFNANTHFDSGKIKINSPFYGWKLNDNLIVSGTFPSFTSTLDLNGHTLTIDGDLKQSDSSGYMYINGGTLNVNGNYLLYSETTDSTTHIKTKSYGGTLKMVKQTDTVNVSGNYETFAYETSSYLNDGTLNIHGNFTHWGYPFNPGDNLTINFLKDGITEVSFANTSAHFNSNTHFKSGKLKLSGQPSGWTLHQNLTFSDTLPAFSGTFDLNGYTMNISDDLNQPSGTIKVNGGTLNISGNYNLYGTKTNEVSDLEEYISGGTLVTSKAADVVNIGKDFVAYGDESSSSLQYGTININGDLTHLGYNFAPSNNVTLNFKKVGTTTLNFASTAGHLNTNSHFSSGNVMILGKPMGWTLNEDITIYGDMPAFTGTFDLNGHGLTFEKSLTQPTGSIKVNCGTLHMKGDYNLHSTKIDDVTDEKTLASGGSFLMQNVKDKVTIDGNFTVYSSNGSDYLKAGTLTLKGNLKQEGGSYSFYPTYLHKTILAGNATPDKKQKVSFTNSNCKFYFLELTKPRDCYEFNPDNCWHDIKQVEKTDLSSAKVTLSKEEYIYQKGKSVEPEVTVVLDKDTLTNGTDYTVTFSDNGKPGTGKLTIEGINLYKGTIEKTFTITCKHTFSEWKIVKEPSTTEKGRKERICSICNTKESADLDKSNIQEVPDGTTRLDQNSFKGNTSITEVTLPDSLEIIGENAFAECSKLQKIVLPAEVTKIENSAFRNCPELMQIVIQKNVTEIAENAFENSPNVVIYGESGSYAEKYASQHNIPFRLLSEDNIHWKHSGGKATCNKRAVCEICKKEYGKKDASVHTGGTKIVNKKDATTTAEGYTGDTICLGCNATLKKGTIIPKLKKLVTPSKPSKPTKPSAPAKGTVLETGRIKYTVIVVAKNKTGQVSLSKGKNTASVTVPATIKLNGFTYSVTQIGNSAFAKSSKLKKVIIGKNVSIIGSKAFYQCKNLKTIRIKSTILKKVGAKAFSGTHKKLVIQVPKKQKKAYTKLLKSKGQRKQTKIK